MAKVGRVTARSYAPLLVGDDEDQRPEAVSVDVEFAAMVGAAQAASLVAPEIETDDGYERDGWRAINTALGLTAIRIPEAYGGYGLRLGDQCIVLEEMGRALLCAPYFATAVLAAGAVMNAGTEAEKQALLPGIAAGETTATL